MATSCLIFVNFAFTVCKEASISFSLQGEQGKKGKAGKNGSPGDRVNMQFWSLSLMAAEGRMGYWLRGYDLVKSN